MASDNDENPPADAAETGAGTAAAEAEPEAPATDASVTDGPESVEDESEAELELSINDVFEVAVGLEDQMGQTLGAVKGLEEQITESDRSLTAKINGMVLPRLEQIVHHLQQGDGMKKAFDTLYEEMRQYKEDFLLKASKPVFIDLILLYDQFAAAVDGLDDAARAKVDVLREGLLEVLYRRDIEPMAALTDEDGPVKFDREHMKAVRRVETDDPALDRTVERMVREGFLRDGKVFRPREVVVRRHAGGETESVAPADDATEDDTADQDQTDD